MRYLALLLLAGCVQPATFIDVWRRPPDDWPELRQSVVRVSHEDVRRLCKLSEGHYLGCAYIDFDKRTCRIYIASDDPAVLQHERDHCIGYDHTTTPRGGGVQGAWEHYKRLHAKPDESISFECWNAPDREKCMRSKRR